MQMLEKFIAYIAPHYCIGCGSEGQLLCAICAKNVFDCQKGYCISCQKKLLCVQFCNACRNRNVLGDIRAIGPYEAELKQLIYALKFSGIRSAAGVLARGMVQTLPTLPQSAIVTHLPTSPARVRQRGYDQAALIAKAIAKELALSYKPLLRRQHGARQVGTNRQQRLVQAQQAYALVTPVPDGATILLVDDVVTTGASMQAAAQCFASHISVIGIAAAHKM